MKTCVGPLLAAGFALGGGAGARAGLLEARDGRRVPFYFSTTPLIVGLYAASGACMGACLPLLPLLAVPLCIRYGVEHVRGRRASA